jgi:hypothetical protein
MDDVLERIVGRVIEVDPLQPLPTDQPELKRCLADPQWRLFSGCLYKIMIKGDNGEDSLVMRFKPNRAQCRFIKRMWHRNLILKARQLGFTTLIAILWLDHALWNANQRCGIIAQDKDAAKVIFRDKVKFGYDNLPEEIRNRFPLAADNADELLFAHNNSSIRVATSMRSGTIHRLHVSEFGKICAKYPDKAAEVVTGSIPAVPINGILIIESTAEGREGEYFEMVQRAIGQDASRAVLTIKDYRFHFYAWWMEPRYRLPSDTVNISAAEHDYFDGIEAIMSTTLDLDQRAFYVATRSADFSGAEERMWQEYPSTPDEAFQISTEGNYYAKDMATLRQRGGITTVPILDLPTNTYWDIGNTDGCAVWFGQEMRGEDRFIDYYEAHGEDLRHYATELKKKGYLFGTHYLPHDAAHKRLSDYNRSTQEMLQTLLPGETFIVVPLITSLITGIQQTRKHLKGAYFDQVRAKLGIERIEGYRKKFSRADNRFTDQPDKTNGCSEGADALRQWAQAKELGLTGNAASTYDEAPPPDWRT